MNMIREAIQKELTRALGTDEPTRESPPVEQGALRIVVLDRGWIVVGRVFRDGDWTRIEDAAVIRNWGTSRGLGEIAEGGPTSKTVLDKCPTVRARTTILELECKEAAWTK